MHDSYRNRNRRSTNILLFAALMFAMLVPATWFYSGSLLVGFLAAAVLASVPLVIGAAARIVERIRA